MKNVFTKKFILFIFLLLIIFSLNVKAYDREKAVKYANDWWNTEGGDKYNKAYNYYSHDCANYVSQCLIAGGIDLEAGPSRDIKGAIPAVDDLHKHLVNTQKTGEPTTIKLLSTAGGKQFDNLVPSNIEAGDVIIFGKSVNDYAHAVIVVEGKAFYFIILLNRYSI